MSVFDPSAFTRPQSVTILPRGIPGRAATAIAIIPAGVPIGSRVKLDATLSQTHDRSIEAPDHPVEEGLNVTDHSRRNPDTLSVNGILTDTPIDPSGKLGAFGVMRNRAHEELRKLNGFFVKREPIFVATSTRVYEAMLIMQMSWVREQEQGNAIGVSLDLKEVRIVNALQIPSIDDLDGLLFGGEGSVDGGTQSAGATSIPAGGV